MNGCVAVIVGNLSPEVTDKELKDFFAFCGPIVAFKLTDTPALEDAGVLAGKEAVIEFNSTKSADTALLLTNAIIHDRPIAVTYFQGIVSDLPAMNSSDATPGGTGLEAIDANKRSNTSVIASLFAAGYVLASDALDHAKRMDEGFQVTSSLLGAAAMIQLQSAQGYRKLSEIMADFDQKHGLSTVARSLTDKVATSVSQVDDQLKIGTTAKEAYASLDTAARENYEKLQKNVYLQNVYSQLAAWETSFAEYSKIAQERYAEPVISGGRDIIDPVISGGREYIDREITEIKKAVDEAKATRRSSFEGASSASDLSAEGVPSDAQSNPTEEEKADE